MKTINLYLGIFLWGMAFVPLQAQKISNISSLTGEKDMNVQFTPLKNDSCLDCELYGKINYSLRGQERESYVCFDSYLEDFYEIFEGEIVAIKGNFNNIVCDDGSMYNYFDAHYVKPYQEISRNLIRSKLEAIEGSDMQIEVTGSLLTGKQAQEALDFHNQVRAEVGNPPLTWSPELALHAQDWAHYLATEKNCQIMHRPNDGSQWSSSFGENIYWSMGRNDENLALSASKLWYDEKLKYTYEAINASNWMETGHYTQMIWKSTTQVGIGIANCSNGATIIVANYNPPGNMLREKPY